MSCSGSYIMSSIVPSCFHRVWMSGKGVTKQVTYSFFSTLRIPFAAVGLVSCIQEFVRFIFNVKYFVYPLVVRLVLLDLSLLLVFSSSKVLSLLTSLKILVLIFSFGLFCTLLLVMFFFCYFLNLHTWCIFLTFFFQHLRLYAYYSGLPFPKLISFIYNIFKFHFFSTFHYDSFMRSRGFFN